MNRSADRHPTGNRLVATLLALASTCFLPVQLPSAETGESKSALEADPQGWVDILPPTDLKGWYRVPVPPTGKLGRDQWHVDAEKKLLICDGDGGHDMLLLERGNRRRHFAFRILLHQG